MPINNVVDIQASVSGLGSLGRDFGQVLLLRSREAASVADPAILQRDALVTSYSTFSDLAKDYSDGSINMAGKAYFDQVPYPQPLNVATFFQNGTPAYLFGSKLPLNALERIQALTALPSDSPITSAAYKDANTTYIIDSKNDLFKAEGNGVSLSIVGVIDIDNDIRIAWDTANDRLLAIDLEDYHVYSVDEDTASTTFLYTLAHTNLDGTPLSAAEFVGTRIVAVFKNQIYQQQSANGATLVARGSAISSSSNLLANDGEIIEIVPFSATVALLISSNGALATHTISTGAQATAGTAPSGEGMTITGYLAGTDVSLIVQDENGFRLRTAYSLSDGASVQGGMYHQQQKVTFDGQSYNVNVQSATSLSDVAQALEDALSDVAVQYHSDQFILTRQDDIHTGFTSSALIVEMGLDPDSSTTSAHIDAETLKAALDRVKRTDSDWYWLVLDNSISNDANIEVAADWCERNGRYFVFQTSSENVLNSVDTSSVVYRLNNRDLERVSGIFSHSADNKALSYAARFSAVNFSDPTSLITGKFVALPGMRGDNLSDEQVEVLNRKRMNHYTAVGGQNIIREGVSFGGWTDVKFWLDWFVDACQKELFKLLLENRIEQTDAGIAVIKSAVNSVCEKGVRNGGIAPGQVHESIASQIRDVTDNLGFDGFLSNGYLTNIGSIADQSPIDRAERKSPPVNVWFKGSGAIHFIDVSVLFEQ